MGPLACPAWSRLARRTPIAADWAGLRIRGTLRLSLSDIWALRRPPPGAQPPHSQKIPRKYGSSPGPVDWNTELRLPCSSLINPRENVHDRAGVSVRPLRRQNLHQVHGIEGRRRKQALLCDVSDSHCRANKQAPASKERKEGMYRLRATRPIEAVVRPLHGPLERRYEPTSRSEGPSRIASTQEGLPMKTCSISRCRDKVVARSWCKRHYSRWQRHGDPLKKVVKPLRWCSVDGCGRTHEAKGLCSLHYGRVKTHNSTSDPPPARIGHRARLTAQDVREIRRRYRAGESHKALAGVYRVHPTTVLRAAKGQTWKHI